MPTIEWRIGWDALLTVIGALILIGGAVIVVWKVINPIAAKATRVADLILGRPKEQGIPAIPSMVDRIDEVRESVHALDVANTSRLDAQNEQIAAIKAEVTPNHGSSSHDKITQRIDKVESKMDAILVHLGLAASE